MTVDAYDRAALGALRSDDVNAYLAAQGWRRLDDFRRMARWVRPDEHDFEVLVPLEPRLADFTARVRDLVESLGIAEERAPGIVLRDLLSARADAIRFRVRPRGEQDGSIPIKDGVVLFEQTRRVLVAAACSAVRRRAHHPTVPPRTVSEYLGGVRLGQTERGSYVVTLLSPVEPPSTGADRSGRLRLPIPDPFPRRAVEMLARAARAATDSAERVAAADGHDLGLFLEAVEQGVSANLCDSLAKIGGVQRGGFSMSFGWAPVLPAPGLATSVEFSDRTISVLERAAELLRAVDAGSVSLRGSVVRLQRQRDRGSGRIRVELAAGEPHQVAVDLDEADYDQAIFAHRQHLQVAVDGRLVREGRLWVLAQPRNFRILHPEPGA